MRRRDLTKRRLRNRVTESTRDIYTVVSKYIVLFFAYKYYVIFIIDMVLYTCYRPTNGKLVKDVV